MKDDFLASFLTMSRRKSLVTFGGAIAAIGFVNRTASAESEIDWNKVSSHFLLDESLTYLNTGSLGSTPRSVLESRRLIEQKLESNPVGEGFGSVLRQAEAVAGKLADLLTCDVKEVSVTRNTTEAINFIAEGINLQPGQRVLTSNQEHGGGLGAWKYLQKYRGVEIDTAEIGSPPKDEDEIVDQFKKQIKPQTRVILCSYVTFSNGVKVPIARLSELAHQRNCLMIVDGAQATGGIPVNVKQLGCDAYASSGHKFLLGPKGTGILYISERARDQIKPMQLDDGYGYYTAIRGTNSMPEAIGLGEVIDWFKELGRDAVYSRLMSLRNSLYEVLQKTPHIKIDSPPPQSSMASHLVCFRLTNREKYPQLQEQLQKDKVIVKVVGINGIDYRLGAHLYNTEEDVAKFAESLKKGVA